jgi:hypothetical protein
MGKCVELNGTHDYYFYYQSQLNEFISLWLFCHGLLKNMLELVGLKGVQYFKSLK